jgi:hypothetical protein
MRAKDGLSVLALAVLLPAFAAERLNGEFGTTEAGAPQDANEACIEIDGEEFDVSGEVTATVGNCLVVIEYNSNRPHQASASALLGDDTKGSAKVAQRFFTPTSVEVGDAGLLDCPAATEFSGEVDVWRCKAAAAIRGTAVDPPGDDTLRSARVSMICDLGGGGANIDTDDETDDVQPPTADQFQALRDAFAGRDDVALTRKGILRIRQHGVADTASPFGGCAP